MTDHHTRSRAAELEAALTAYQETWQQIENERGEYVRANERHRLAMFDALRAAEKERSATPDRVERFGDLDQRALLEAAFGYEALVVIGSTASKKAAMWNAVAILLAHGYELRRIERA